MSDDETDMRLVAAAVDTLRVRRGGDVHQEMLQGVEVRPDEVARVEVGFACGVVRRCACGAAARERSIRCEPCFVKRTSERWREKRRRQRERDPDKYRAQKAARSTRERAKKRATKPEPCLVTLCKQCSTMVLCPNQSRSPKTCARCRSTRDAAQVKKWREQNPEAWRAHAQRERERQRLRRQADPAAAREAALDSYYAHREKRKAAALARYHANKERCLEYQKQYRAKKKAARAAAKAKP